MEQQTPRLGGGEGEQSRHGPLAPAVWHRSGNLLLPQTKLGTARQGLAADRRLQQTATRLAARSDLKTAPCMYLMHQQNFAQTLTLKRVIILCSNANVRAGRHRTLNSSVTDSLETLTKNSIHAYVLIVITFLQHTFTGIVYSACCQRTSEPLKLKSDEN